MPRYDAEVKAKAKQMMSEIGVSKTHEAMNINIQTLYKWRHEMDDASKNVLSAEAPSAEQQKVIELLNAQSDLADQLDAARQENAKLAQALADANAKRAEEAAKYKKQIKTMRKVIDMLMED